VRRRRRGVAERFEEVGLAGPGRAAHDEVLVPVDPLECAQRPLGGCGDRGDGLVPGVEGLAGREPGSLAAGPDRGCLPAGELLGEQCPDGFGGSQRCALAVASRSGAVRRMCGRRSCAAGRRPRRSVRRAAVIGHLRSLPRRRCRAAASGRRRRAAVAGRVGGQDRGQVAVGETGVGGGVPERPVDPRRCRAGGRADGFGHLHLHPAGAGRGGLDQPDPGAFTDGQELGLGRARRLGLAGQRPVGRGG
jgi:hypothetical protein